MKRYLLILFFSIPCFNASFGQGFAPFRAFEIGAGLTQNSVIGDAETIKRTYSPDFSISYNPGLFNSFIAGFQLGKLQGGDYMATYSGRQFSNKFYSFYLRGQCGLGNLFGESDDFLISAMNNVYVSSGIGLIRNNITEINRRSLYIEDYYTDGVDHSVNLFVPARVGYDLKVLNYFKEVVCRIDIAYQYNKLLDDDVDGFKAGVYKDVLSQFSVGVKVGISGKRRARY